MDNRIIVESMHTGGRADSGKNVRTIIWLYNDGTWEAIFKARFCCNLHCISANKLKGLTREQAIAKLEVLYYNGELEGRFLDC